MLQSAASVAAISATLPPIAAPFTVLAVRHGRSDRFNLAYIALFLDLYRDAVIDRIAGADEARAWNAIRPGSCADYRAFLRSHSDGVKAPEAQAMIASKETRRETRWQRIERPLPIYIPSHSIPAAPNEATARRSALARARPVAERMCQNLSEASLSRVIAVSVQAQGYDCDRLGTGTVCGLVGVARCQLNEPQEIEVETCSGPD